MEQLQKRKKLGMSSAVSLPEISSHKSKYKTHSQDLISKSLSFSSQASTKKIKFSPCSPGQVLTMAKLLGVDAKRDFYLLPLVRKAILAPFPQDWSFAVDQKGETYYYNLFTHKVLTAHPLSETFLDWIANSKSQHEEAVKQLQESKDEEDEDKTLQSAQFGNPWMKFTTSNEGEEYWFNFAKEKLFTVAQYQYQLEQEFKERQVKASGQVDKNKVEKTKKEQRLRKVLGIFTGNLRMKYWLRWTSHILELRAAQAQALVKSGLVSGRHEAKGFRQWKQKMEQLAFVRRVMAPLGGRRDKAIVRDAFNSWSDAAAAAAAERRSVDALREGLLAWRALCQRKRSVEKIKDVVRSMLRSGNLSLNFAEWRAVANRKRDREAEALIRACTALQRLYRARIRRRDELRRLVNRRRAIKTQLFRLCDSVDPLVRVYTRDPLAELAAASGDPAVVDDAPQSFAVCLLEGAAQVAATESERARLRQVSPPQSAAVRDLGWTQTGAGEWAGPAVPFHSRSLFLCVPFHIFSKLN